MSLLPTVLAAVTSVLLTAILVSTLATLLVAWLRTAPTRARCPQCREPTTAVLPPGWLPGSARWIRRRWCSSCAWEGIGRAGPDYSRDYAISHDSGFHWGDDEMGPNQGFEWAERKGRTAPEPPAPPPVTSWGFGFRPTAGRPDFRWRHVSDRAPRFEWR